VVEHNHLKKAEWENMASEENRKEGFVSELDTRPVKSKAEILNQRLIITDIKSVTTKFGPQKVYGTKDFVFFGSSVLDRADEDYVKSRPVAVVKVADKYYAFAEKN